MNSRTAFPVLRKVLKRLHVEKRSEIKRNELSMKESESLTVKNSWLFPQKISYDFTVILCLPVEDVNLY